MANSAIRKSIDIDDRLDSAKICEPTSIPLQVGGRVAQLAFCSSAMTQLVAKAERFANSSAAVLITGESGTGKELISRLIHLHSQRCHNPFVAVNCAALPENLIESELFGHERGAFTGAFQKQIGFFHQAHQGTLLLDEVSEMAVPLQAKLLRVLEEHQVYKVGSRIAEDIDVRIIATSNKNLIQAINDKEFRGDLYHRLSVLKLEIPPLRERGEDIALLAEHFLNQFKHESKPPIQTIDAQAKRKLIAYDWPGNVRQLRNVIHAACVQADSETIRAKDLDISEPFFSNTQRPVLKLFDIEKETILSTLDKHGGNRQAAALELGVSSRTITNKLRIYKSQ